MGGVGGLLVSPWFFFGAPWFQMVSDWWKAIRAVKTISKSQMKNLERFKQEIVPSSEPGPGGWDGRWNTS